jgi:dTDP-4-amino-4,6-dideoxygalactose transaminase
MRSKILTALESLVFDQLGEATHVRREFESAFALQVQQKYACAVHSGTLGLFLALRACGVGPGDQVITVGNSDVSTTAAISHCGAVPVLCRVREMDYTMDPDAVEPLITDQTVAILPVDLYGHPVDAKALRSIADDYGLKIVEDAALAAGARDHGRSVGAFADVTLFSFAPFKPLGSVGNGGMLVTSDPELAMRIRLLCSYGHAPDTGPDIHGRQQHIIEGYNMPLDPLQAALLQIKLPHLNEWTEKRRQIASAYARGLQGTAAILPTFRPESEPTFRSYTVRVPDQVKVYQAMRAAGVEVVLHYTPPVYRQPVYPSGLVGSDALPLTDRLAQEILCLPVTVELTDDDVDYAVATLRSLL